jgi:hypothetical protein
MSEFEVEACLGSVQSFSRICPIESPTETCINNPTFRNTFINKVWSGVISVAGQPNGERRNIQFGLKLMR